MNPSATTPLGHRASWSQRLPDDQKRLYVRVLGEAKRRGLRFALGGGFASNVYTGVWRNTKDLDLFVLCRDRELFIALLSDLGLTDYYEQKPYDRSWIYRGWRDDQIVDVIWQMANHRAGVDEVWLESGPSIELEGVRVPLIPPEETLWTKLYVLQRERCDWPDALNLISSLGPELDWTRLIERLGSDTALLTAVLSVFAWICPHRALGLPVWIWDRLQARRPEDGEPRAHLLDSRPWLENPC
jgi:Nucleotidyl transferase of unknown function (DUF2204)